MYIISFHRILLYKIAFVEIFLKKNRKTKKKKSRKTLKKEGIESKKN